MARVCQASRNESRRDIRKWSVLDVDLSRGETIRVIDYVPRISDTSIFIAMRWISRISNEIIGTSIQGSHFIYVNSECPIRITKRSINTSTRITFYIDEIFYNVIKWSSFNRDFWLDLFTNKTYTYISFISLNFYF